MSKASDEKKTTKLLERLVELMSQVNLLEKTFSRIKNEGEELLRKLLKVDGQVDEDNIRMPQIDKR